MRSKNSMAMIIAIAAGILLIISGISGMATWETIKNYVLNNVTDNEIVQIVFAILIFIASLGGLSVIIGGVLIGKYKIGLGKLFITLGAGLGIIGLIFSIIVAYTEDSLTLGTFFSLGMIGLILSIVARMLAKKQ